VRIDGYHRLRAAAGAMDIIMKFDLHIHSKYSPDGNLDPEAIVRIARNRKLSGIAITDHNTIRGSQEAQKYATGDFNVIIGAEIQTDAGEIIGLFLSREIKSYKMMDVIHEIKSQAGIVVVPHPFDRMRHAAFHITGEYVRLIDAIEGFNARCIFQRYNQEAQEFAARYKIPVIGGSDAHYANEIGLGGSVTDSYDIRKSILDFQVKCYGSRSPIVNHARTKIYKLYRQYFK
jgi:predicted metal-dependent phosphoesterase TrpH